MVKEMSTLYLNRPTTLDEKRRIERDLGLPVEPSPVFPRGNDWRAGSPGVWKRIAQWMKGTTP